MLNGVSGQVQLECVCWWFEDKKLWCDIWLVIDSFVDVKLEEVLIFSDVKEMMWCFWKEGWQNKWIDMVYQLDGVEFLLIMENGDIWCWVFIMLGDMLVVLVVLVE